MDKIKKLRVKQSDGTFSDYIAIGVDGQNVDLSSGENLETALGNKVDKVTGKGLSTEDYTTAEKTKLNGIQQGAQVNPTNVSELTNDAGYITSSAISGLESTTNKTTTIDETSTDDQYPSAKAVYDAIEAGGGGSGGGGGIPIGTVTNITATAADEGGTVSWTDPSDVVIDGYTLASWGGTKLVIKTGSYPTSARDGIVKVDSKTRNQYSSTGYVVTGLENNVTYYGALFPYSNEGYTNTAEANRFTITPGAIYPSAATNIAVSENASDLTLTCTFDLPLDATKATVVMKEGSIPANSTDGTVVSNITTGTATFSGIVKDTVYYFRVFTYNAKNRETAAEAVTGKIASLEIVTFENGTDDQIAAMLEAHYNGDIDIADYWSVGDKRKIHLNQVANPKGSGSAWAAQDITIVITAIKHHDLATPINGKTKAAITCQTRECVNNNTAASDQDGHIYPNLTYTENYLSVWASSSPVGMRTWANGAFYTTAMPTGTKDMIKEITRNLKTTHSGSTLAAATDKIFLPTEYEIFGANESSGTAEGTQWEYYKTTSNRIKYGNNGGNSNGTAQNWWTGSPGKTFDDFWCHVNTDGTANRGRGAGARAYGFAPAFAM